MTIAQTSKNIIIDFDTTGTEVVKVNLNFLSSVMTSINGSIENKNTRVANNKIYTDIIISDNSGIQKSLLSFSTNTSLMFDTPYFVSKNLPGNNIIYSTTTTKNIINDKTYTVTTSGYNQAINETSADTFIHSRSTSYYTTATPIALIGNEASKETIRLLSGLYSTSSGSLIGSKITTSTTTGYTTKFTVSKITKAYGTRTKKEGLSQVTQSMVGITGTFHLCSSDAYTLLTGGPYTVYGINSDSYSGETVYKPGTTTKYVNSSGTFYEKGNTVNYFNNSYVGTTVYKGGSNITYYPTTTKLYDENTTTSSVFTSTVPAVGLELCEAESGTVVGVAGTEGQKFYKAESAVSRILNVPEGEEVPNEVCTKSSTTANVLSSSYVSGADIYYERESGLVYEGTGTLYELKD